MIKQRTKSSKLTVKESLPFPFEHLKLEIGGSPDAWYRLYALTFKPRELGKIIFEDFVAPAVRHLVRRPPRGKNAKRIGDKYKRQTRGEFIEWIKNLTAYSHAIISYWLKKPRRTWPRTVRIAMQEFMDNPEFISGRKIATKADEMVAYIMEKDFGREREKYGLKPWTEDPDSFRRTYIFNNEYKNYYKICIDRLIKPDRLADLPLSTEDPLKVTSSLL